MEETSSGPRGRTDGVELPCQGSTWNPDLLEELQGLLHQGTDPGDRYDQELRRLEGQHGLEVYSDFLYLLSHLRFHGSEAKRHW